MPKNVMKLLKPSPHRARNDFDLSHRHVFDANFGELLPATCIETVPGDNITLHASDLLRAIPFVSSPFLRAKQHLDVWFVPYHDLWHQFDAFITKKTEPVSSAFKSASYCPWVYQYDLYTQINARNTAGDKDVVGRSLSDRSYYLLQLLGYGDIYSKHGSVSGGVYNSFKVNPFRLAAYNYIWYNEYRQQYYDDGTRLMDSALNNPAALFNFDRLTCDSEANANVYGASGTAKLLASMCQMRYRTWKKDLFTGVLPSTQFGNVSTIGISGTVNISGSASLSGTTGLDSDRHQLLDGSSSVSLPSGIYVSGFSPGSGSNRTSRIYQEDSDGNLSQYVTIDGQPVTVLDKHDHTISGTASLSSYAQLNSGTGFDVLALRKSEAIQIWRENALRAGNHIKDNMLAHYGIASDFNDHRPTYLGSVSAPLNIGDIAATANSTGVNDVVGDIAGKGLSSLSEKVFKFHAKDFGVIMVMFSMLPEAEYDAIGIERCNQLLEAEDFFIPEYENLGLEAVSSINFGPGAYGEPTEALVRGYAPRYFAYKTKLDKCFGQFTGNGVFRTWTSQRQDVTTDYTSIVPQSAPLANLYVNPAIYDANFNVGISNSPQFLCDMYFDVDAVRPMSVIGMPFS